MEVIVVDNASRDETRAVIEGFVRDAGHVPVEYLWEPRQGVSYGRNAGVARASGRVIAFTDDDIQVSPDWVEQLWRVLEQHPGIDCVGGPVLPLWSAEPPAWLDKKHWSPLSVTDYGPQTFEVSARRPVCLVTSNLAFRREVFDRIGLFSPAFPRAQDHELQVRFWRAGGRALYSPAVVVHTDVPRERMTLRYHRRWHVQNGRMCARMELREQIGPDGVLRPPPAAPRLICGVPGFLWRELAAAAVGWLGAVGRDRAGRLDREMAVRHLVGYIAEQPSVRSPRLDMTRAALAATGMTLGRVAGASILTLGIVGGAAVDVVRDSEHWPFSPYPMFSTIDRGRDHQTVRLFGVARDSGREFPLTDEAYIYPFDQCRVSTAFARIEEDHTATTRLHAALADVFARYERRRHNGSHAGPPLSSVRLYRLKWATLDPAAANVSHPDQRALLGDYAPLAASAR